MEGGMVRPEWAVKGILVVILTSILFRCVSATNHSVGGPTGWDLASNIQAWTASTTFYAGDYLVFSYGPTHDVLEVNQVDFVRCQTINPISAYNDGETVVQLREASTRYFICGRLGHCAMGLRLRLQVLPRTAAGPSNKTTPPAPELTPPPSPPPPLPVHHSEGPGPCSQGVFASDHFGIRMANLVYCCLLFIATVIIFS